MHSENVRSTSQADTSQADHQFSAGIRILDETMRPFGFAFKPKWAGFGSGGYALSGLFQRRRFWQLRADRSLELHFRYSLGLVAYRVGKVSLSHEDYMWAVVGRRAATHYPGFSSDPRDGFRHLQADLVEHGSVFLSGSAAEFEILHRKAVALRASAPRLP